MMAVRWMGVFGLLGVAGWIAACDETRLRVVTNHYDLFFPQGAPQVDTFEQKAAALIDILWVIDNSPSMIQEQDNLGANFQSFIQVIEESGVDYQIGVISTDMDLATHKGALQGSPLIITPGPNAEAQFNQNVHVGTTGAGFERGLEAAYMALTPPLINTVNQGFLRQGAALAIIFVSDEDDHSFGKISFFQRTFEQMKGIGNENRVLSGAMVGDLPDGCSAATGKAAAGERYHELVQLVGGSVGSICDADFSATLNQLGLTVAGLARKFTISDPNADPSTITVTVDGVEVPAGRDNGWTYENGSIFFSGSYVPPPASVIEVSFLHPEREFVLTQVPVYSVNDPGADIHVKVYPPEAASCTQQTDCQASEPCGLAGKCGGSPIPCSLESGWVLEERTEAAAQQYIIAFEREYFPPGGSTVEVVYRCMGGCK